MKSIYSCGVDIGGTHITTALVNTINGTILQASQHRSLVDASANASEIIQVWAGMIRKSLSFSEGRVNIGVAMPGPFDYDQGISYIKEQHKFDSLYGLNVKQLLADALGQPSGTITFANDTASFLQGEVFSVSGCAAGKKSVMGVTLGTGIGCALFTYGIAEDADLWKSPFLESIAEDYLSSRWLVSRFQALSGETGTDVKAIAGRYQDNEHARSVFSEFGSNLGYFLAQHLQETETEMVVLGGSISQSFALFEREVFEQLARCRMSIPVVRSALGEQAALIGAVDINTLVTAL